MVIYIKYFEMYLNVVQYLYGTFYQNVQCDEIRTFSFFQTAVSTKTMTMIRTGVCKILTAFFRLIAAIAHIIPMVRILYYICVFYVSLMCQKSTKSKCNTI